MQFCARGRTWADVVREEWGDVDGDAVELLLWECTCYPCGTVEMVRAQLRDLRGRVGGDVQRAVEISHAEMDAAMAEGREER